MRLDELIIYRPHSYPRKHLYATPIGSPRATIPNRTLDPDPYQPSCTTLRNIFPINLRAAALLTSATRNKLYLGCGQIGYHESSL